MEIIANNLESFAMEFEEKYFFVRVDRTYKSDKKNSIKWAELVLENIFTHFVVIVQLMNHHT